MGWRAQWVYVFIVGFGLGVLWRSFFNFGFSFLIFLVLLTFSITLLYILRRDKNVFFVTILLLGVSLGVIRFDISDLSQGNAILNAFVDNRIVAEGVVVTEPDERESNTQLTVLFDVVNDTSVNSKTLIVAHPFPRVSYGDRLRIDGILQKPEGFVSDNNRYFDYAAYLGKDDIFYQVLFPKIEVVSSGEANALKQYLFMLKGSFLESIEKVIPEPHASLLGGLVVGAKQSLGEELLTDFRVVGLIHIVVLSGYNITIIIEFIKRVFARLGGTLTNIGSVVLIVLFVIMTGASATAIRAGIMGGIVILAHATGRVYDMVRSLFIAGFLMILFNPKTLVFDASFQLSFMATLGLIYLAPKLEEVFGWVPSKWQVREFAVATLATQLFVLPILLYKMGELSLVALLVNILVLGVIPLTMLFGFITGVLGFVSTMLSLPFAWVTTFFLSYQLKIVEWSASLPFSAVHIETFPLWVAVGFYALLGFMLLKYRS
jgi:competence protein ComEC